MEKTVARRKPFVKRCECGSSYIPPLHHCRLMCQACREGTCTQSQPVEASPWNQAWSRTPCVARDTSVQGVISPMPARMELTPAEKLVCVGLVSLGVVAVLELLEDAQ